MLSIYLSALSHWHKSSWKYRKVSVWSCFASSKKNRVFFCLHLKLKDNNL